MNFEIKDGIVKVYKLNTNILIFEGEYQKGKRNGKGKEYYDNGELEFLGEYINYMILQKMFYYLKVYI